jgi:hypothetical protein
MPDPAFNANKKLELLDPLLAVELVAVAPFVVAGLLAVLLVPEVATDGRLLEVAEIVIKVFDDD